MSASKPAASAARIHPVADGYLLWRFFKEGLRRITGVPTDAPLLTTLFATGVLGSALRPIAVQWFKMILPKRPTAATIVMAGAVAREMPGSIGGVHTRNEPFAGTMIMAGLVQPVLQALRLVTASARRIAAALVAFVRRYGI